MDTKWKKWKIGLSWSAFIFGITLLIYSLVPLSGFLLRERDPGQVWRADYQESSDFYYYISDCLEKLLGVAVGGESRNPGEQKSLQESLDSSMEALAQNKNLCYAVVYQGRLLYTNLDGFENQKDQAWNGMDFYETLSKEEYNFYLWVNRDGDGKVEIYKDGIAEELYEDGIYWEENHWYVPEYTNFNVDAARKDVVIFLAAAKEPKLYIAESYLKNGGIEENGISLYWMHQNALRKKKELTRDLILFVVAGLLLAVSLIWRKEKQQGDLEAACFLEKIWLEIKLMVLIILLIGIFVIMAGGEIGDFVGNKIFLISCFWLVYLAVLDIRFNKGKQKKPLLNGLRTRELKYPLQKRMVRQYNLIWITSAAALLLCGLMVIGLYVDIDYMGYLWEEFINGAYIVLVILLAACIIISIVGWKKNRQMAEDIGTLADQIRVVREGDLTHPLRLPEDADLRQAAENLNEIQHGLEEALREQMQSERMKVDLVTNVSHDIKTPLTSIISYVELLKQEEDLPEHVEEFVRILDEKSERLNTIVQDVFDISKATSGQLPIAMEELDYGKLLRQTLADMAVSIEESGLVMKVSIPETPVMIRADGQRLYRVFQNLLQNALKYSLQGSRIYLTLTDTGAEAATYIKNTSGTELSDTFDFTERFVRGDESRTDGGSGLGLSIARSFTEVCGGSLRVKVDADLFTVVVTFPKEEMKEK